MPVFVQINSKSKSLTWFIAVALFLLSGFTSVHAGLQGPQVQTTLLAIPSIVCIQNNAYYNKYESNAAAFIVATKSPINRLYALLLFNQEVAVQIKDAQWKFNKIKVTLVFINRVFSIPQSNELLIALF